MQLAYASCSPEQNCALKMEEKNFSSGSVWRPSGIWLPYATKVTKEEYRESSERAIKITLMQVNWHIGLCGFAIIQHIEKGSLDRVVGDN